MGSQKSPHERGRIPLYVFICRAIKENVIVWMNDVTLIERPQSPDATFFDRA